jgi:hypothetical protein
MGNYKFNRLLRHPGYNVEGMLIGAAVGGGTALLTGEDVLTGALMGAGTAGLTSGAQGLLGAANTAALDTAIDTGVGVGTQAATEAATAAQSAAQSAMTAPTVAPIGGISTAAGQGISSGAATQGLPTAVSQGAYPNFAANAVPQGAVSTANLPGAQMGVANAARATAQPGLMTQTSDWWNSLSPMEKAGVGIGGSALLSSAMAPNEMPEEEEYDGVLNKFKYDPTKFRPSTPTPRVYQPRYAQGGIAAVANQGYPMGRQDPTQYAVPSQMPMSSAVVNADYEPVEMAVGGMANIGAFKKRKFNPLANFKARDAVQPNVYRPNSTSTSEPKASHIYKPKYAAGGIADYNLGGYAKGGNPRLLKGPGDGMSDDIPATIANKQPARLADGEFVVPADVVSHLGNGSTDAGAKHLYKMMDNVRKARTGKKAQGKQIKSEKFLPA